MSTAFAKASWGALRATLPVMGHLRQTVRGAPALVVLAQAGHCAQALGEVFAQQAVEYFRL